MKIIRLIVAIFYPVLFIILFPFVMIWELVNSAIQYFEEMFMDLFYNYVGRIKNCLKKFKKNYWQTENSMV